MKFKRTALLMLAAGALAVWLAAAATSDHRDQMQLAVAAAAPVDASGAALAKEVARLRDRLRPGVPPSHDRDLFQFAPVKRVNNPAAPVPLVVRPASSEATAAPVPPPPALKLIGIAEDVTPEGRPVRTAIISGPGQLFLVKEGDPVTARYVVAQISPDVVELTDAADHSARRLALK
jgi:hypothetical protein